MEVIKHSELTKILHVIWTHSQSRVTNIKSIPKTMSHFIYKDISFYILDPRYCFLMELKAKEESG